MAVPIPTIDLFQYITEDEYKNSGGTLLEEDGNSTTDNTADYKNVLELASSEINWLTGNQIGWDINDIPDYIDPITGKKQLQSHRISYVKKATLIMAGSLIDRGVKWLRGSASASIGSNFSTSQSNPNEPDYINPSVLRLLREAHLFSMIEMFDTGSSKNCPVPCLTPDDMIHYPRGCLTYAETEGIAQKEIKEVLVPGTNITFVYDPNKPTTTINANVPTSIAKYKNLIPLADHDYDSIEPTSVLSRSTIEGLIQALTLTFYDDEAAFAATSPATGTLAWTDDFDGSGGDNKALMLKTVSDIIEIKDWLDIKNYIDKSTLPHFEHQGTQNYKDFYTTNRNSQTIFSGTGNENGQVRTLAEFSGIDNKDGLYKWTEFSDTGIKRWAYNSTASSIVSENGKTIPSMAIGMLSSRAFAWMGSIANLKDEIITSDDVNGYNWTFGQTYLLTSSIYNYFVTPFSISGTKILKGTSEYSDGIWYVEIDTSQTGSGGFVVNKIGQSAYGDLTNINVGVANAGKIVQVNATGGFDYIHDSVSPLGKVDLDLENSAPTKIGANKVGLKMTGFGDTTAQQVRMHGNNVDLSVGTNTAGKISFSLPAGSTGQVSVNVGTTKHEIGYADGSNTTDTWTAANAQKITTKPNNFGNNLENMFYKAKNYSEFVLANGDYLRISDTGIINYWDSSAGMSKIVAYKKVKTDITTTYMSRVWTNDDLGKTIYANDIAFMISSITGGKFNTNQINKNWFGGTSGTVSSMIIENTDITKIRNFAIGLGTGNNAEMSFDADTPITKFEILE